MTAATTAAQSVWPSVITASGALLGVVVGSLLSSWFIRQSWSRDQESRSRDERRRVFAELLAAAREWRALSLRPDAKIIAASAVSREKHADGGEAATKVLSLATEIALIGRPGTVSAIRELTSAHRRLAEGRAQYKAGSIPESLIAACRSAELRFVGQARLDLLDKSQKNAAGSEEDLARAFGITPDGYGIGKSPGPKT